MSKIGIAYLFACLLLVAACVSEPGSGFLGNFFDGMTSPDPNAPKKDPYRLEVKKRDRKDTGPKAYLHPPFGDGSCKKCHSHKVSNMSPKQTRELCFTCHSEFFTGIDYAHGPVVAGSCLQCHHHHWSRIPGILRRPVQETCLSCHAQADLAAGQCGWQEPKSSCITCHMPHGGGNPFFLKVKEGGG